MRRRSLSIFGDLADNFAQAALGGTKSVVVLLLVALFGIAVNLASGGVSLFLPGRWQLYLGVGVLAAMVVSLWIAIRWFAARLKIRVVEDARPAQCKVLIVFLSPVGPDRGTAASIADGSHVADIRAESDRSCFKKSWRMPLDAIAYHMGRLVRVVVLPSADAPDDTDGTYRDLGLFREVVHRMCGANHPEVSDLSTMGLATSPEVDFEKAEDLVGAIEKVYAWLREKGTPDYDILIDITGGQKVPTVAGATVALDVGRRIQYVSTRDFKVRTYDFTVSTKG